MTTDMHNIVRDALESIDTDSGCPQYEVVGRVCPETTFIGPVGFAPPNSNLGSAEYLLTLRRPDPRRSAVEEKYAQEFDEHIVFIRKMQKELSKGQDAEFLLVYDQGNPAIRLRRLVFDRRTKPVPDLSTNDPMQTWPVPIEFRAQMGHVSRLFTPRKLPVFDKDGQSIDVSMADEFIKKRLIKARYVVRHLALSRGDPGDIVDLFLGQILRIDCLE